LLAKKPDKAVTDVVEGFKMINNGFMDVPTIITPVVLVTKENIDSMVITGGFFTKEQVYGK
jgi:D-xylose transport system substrate-binding protein